MDHIPDMFCAFLAFNVLTWKPWNWNIFYAVMINYFICTVCTYMYVQYCLYQYNMFTNVALRVSISFRHMCRVSFHEHENASSMSCFFGQYNDPLSISQKLFRPNFLEQLLQVKNTFATIGLLMNMNQITEIASFEFLWVGKSRVACYTSVLNTLVVGVKQNISFN